MCEGLCAVKKGTGEEGGRGGEGGGGCAEGACPGLLAH